MRLQIFTLFSLTALALAAPALDPSESNTPADATPVDACAAVCEPPFCIQSFPDSCICANAAKTRCAECRGEAPVLEDCNALGGAIDGLGGAGSIAVGPENLPTPEDNNNETVPTYNAGTAAAVV